MIAFDPIAHTYTTRQGKRLPSVTQALQMITKHWFVDADLLERARIFGHHVHHMTHLFDIGDLDESSLDLELKLYLAQYKRFLRATGFAVRWSEEVVCEQQLGFAGTLDKRGIWRSFRQRTTTALIDIKSGQVPRTVGPQTAAYQRAVAGDRPRRRFALQLRRDDYRLISCDDDRDFPIFLSALNLHRYTNQGNPYVISEEKAAPERQRYADAEEV